MRILMFFTATLLSLLGSSARAQVIEREGIYPGMTRAQFEALVPCEAKLPDPNICGSTHYSIQRGSYPAISASIWGRFDSRGRLAELRITAVRFLWQGAPFLEQIWQAEVDNTYLKYPVASDPTPDLVSPNSMTITHEKRWVLKDGQGIFIRLVQSLQDDKVLLYINYSKS